MSRWPYTFLLQPWVLSTRHISHMLCAGTLEMKTRCWPTIEKTSVKNHEKTSVINHARDVLVKYSCLHDSHLLRILYVMVKNNCLGKPILSTTLVQCVSRWNVATVTCDIFSHGVRIKCVCLLQYILCCGYLWSVLAGRKNGDRCDECVSMCNINLVATG